MMHQQVYCQGLQFKKIEIDTSYSFRGLSVVNDSIAWVSGVGGRVGKSMNGGNKWTFDRVKGFEKSDFRTLYAFNAKTALIANAGSPANILRTSDGGRSWNVVYTNEDSLAFFDGIDFWNDTAGIIYGDPIKGHMLLLQTKDAGKTWQEIPEHRRPVMEIGEASFAASGTAIRCFGKRRAVIATGGKVSRVFISNNVGQTWHAVQTPIIQGKSSQGIFSVAFTNDTTGIIVGGDYKNMTMAASHVFYTTNAGKAWKSPTMPTGGYRECVEFITDKIAIAAGPEGMDVSYNSGMSWNQLKGEKNFHVIRKARKGTLVIGAGDKRISLITY